MSGKWADRTRRDELPDDWYTVIRPYVLHRDEHRCRWREGRIVCGHYANQVDHIVPGNDHRYENLQALCAHHHAVKSSREGNAARWRETVRRPPERHPDRAGVAAVSALVAQTAVGLYGAQSGVAAFHDTVPVEDIASPDGIDAPIVPLARGLSDDLERFLRDPQRGSRRVAKEMLRPVQQIRNGQFAGAAVMGRANQVAGALFQDVPSDHGHFTVPYLAHVLRGLRTEVPSYVRDVLEGRTPPARVTGRLGGIVVIADADAPSIALRESWPDGVPQGPLPPYPEGNVPGTPGKAA